MNSKNNKLLFLIRICVVVSVLIFTFIQTICAQNSGLNFQGVARNPSGVILASQNISLRFSVLNTSTSGTAEYIETRIVTTNAQGIFSLVIGDGTAAATVNLGTYGNINWKIMPKFLKVELDPNGGSNFFTMGVTQLQTVPYSNYSNYSASVDAENIMGIVPVSKGGTGVNDLNILKTNLTLNKVDNTADVDKPISIATQNALNNKLAIADSLLVYVTPTQFKSSKIDTSTLSNRIDLKENVSNKSTAIDLGGSNPSDILFPTQKAVKSYVAANASAGGIADGGVTTIKLADGAVTDTKIHFNAPNLGTPSSLVGTNITGTANGLSIGGNAATVTTNANLTGVVTSVGNTTTIANGAITNSMLNNIAVGNLTGINSGDETEATIKLKLGVTNLFSGSYTELTDKPVIPDIGSFNFNQNSILASDLMNHQNFDPIILGNDNSKIQINAWSENDTHALISNAVSENTITLYSSGNGSSRLLWEDINDANTFSRIQVSSNVIYFRINDDVNNNDFRWIFNNSGDIELPVDGTIVFQDSYNNQVYLSDILPMPTYNQGYVLTENGSGGASWEDKSSFEYLNVFNYGNYPGIYLHQEDLYSPTWLRVGNDGGGAEYGISGGNDQFFEGTTDGDIALKAFSNSNDKKMFIGATFAGKANLVLSPDGNIISNGKISSPKILVGSEISTTNSAALEINSNDKGFLPPRMTDLVKNNINSPATGLIIWCTDCGASSEGELQLFDGNNWRALMTLMPNYTTIANQKWATNNLDVTTYANGDPIYRATSASDFANASANGIGAYIYYNNDSSANASTYGKLYNWYAVNDSRGLAPIGWRIPSQNDIIILAANLGGYGVAGGKLKENGSLHWQSPNTDATNSTHFNGTPGGYIDYLGTFSGAQTIGAFWTSTTISSNFYAYNFVLNNSSGYLDLGYSTVFDVNYGLSVRCIKN